MPVPLLTRPRRRARWTLAVAGTVAALVLAPAARPVLAQGTDSVLTRVQRLVNAGNRDGARALADSVLQAATEGTPEFAEALYARAFASSSAVEAERDYLRVSVEYPLSPRAEDATMMVAQLKLARSDRAGARRNFERLVREHPTGVQSAKAAFWAGRLAIEDGDLPRGCQSLATSRALVSADDVELVNQIDYYRQRCSAGALAAAAPPDTTARAREAGAKETPSAPVSAKARAEAARAEKARLAAERAERAREEKARAAAERAERLRAAEERAREARAERARIEAERAAAARAAVAAKTFSVQVAAFPRERDAEALREVLRQRGYEARVWGNAGMFRVRVGRYDTREAADSVLARMKESRLNGMVVEAEPQ